MIGAPSLAALLLSAISVRQPCGTARSESGAPDSVSKTSEKLGLL